LDVGDDVDVGRISGDQVTLYPGCRIYGAKTVISAGCTLGAEGPVTLEDCRLGPGVELKAGSAKRAVFLERASVGPGAQVREGCLLEEASSGAHSVGLKQTILFPFVTLGSLVNFCDCLMGGGTSRRDHSEVGSSYIHFNFTPDGGKATPSLFGDVARGVMLDRPPIFLGGQGGAVGPVRVAYGTVVAAGSILRRDVLEEGKLVVAGAPPALKRDRAPNRFADLGRVVRNNVLYLANLLTLEAWYTTVRQPFFGRQDLGPQVYEGALEMLVLAKRERSNRLMALAEYVPASRSAGQELRDRAEEVCALFERIPAAANAGAEPFLQAFEASSAATPGGYIEGVRGLTPQARAKGVEWLQGVVDWLCDEAQGLLPSFSLTGTGR
jgi:UDP-N-acetylglucosamine/UDP-N-acetylgalactosamine diphosphorylase